MPNGYTGKILRVNLSENEHKIEERKEIFYRKFFGGRNFISSILLEELDAGVDPLGEKNKLVFATGILTGAFFPGCGRHSVGAKSPLTEGYGDGEAGGYFGRELKKAGFDAVIIEGQAKSPVYLLIKDGKVKIKDARELWNKKTAEAQEMIKDWEGEVSVAQIGPAGENLVKYACIVHDLCHFVGRTGMGAVMGSKNLKAVAVSGSQEIEVANKKKLKDMSKKIASNVEELAGDLYNKGTLRVLPSLNEAGGLPTRNFQQGSFEGAEKLTGPVLREQHGIGTETCYACPIACGVKVELEDEIHEVNSSYKGPEYETVAAFGSNCGIDDLKIIIKANELCNAYGLDTISTGVTISFAIECFERGLISEDETHGYSLGFGKDNILEIINEIANREGLGDLLAEGSKRAAKKWGNGTEKYAVQIKGQEAPLHEPRLKKGLGLGYAISPTGADHTHNLHDTAYVKDGGPMEELKALGYHNPLPTTELSARKASMFKHGTFPRYLADCLVTCFFVPWSINEMVEIVRNVTGWNTTTAELMAVSERSIVQSRLFNFREGFSKEDDQLCDRFKEEFKEGPLKGVKVEESCFAEAREVYYQIMGWDKEGKPLEAKLVDLGLKDYYNS